MSSAFPVGVPANGNVKATWVNTIADPTAPTATELNAAGAVELSCALTSFATNYSQETSEDRRICSTQVFQSPGAISYGMDDIEYIVTPQDDSPTGENKVAIQLTPGETGFFVFRWGKLYSDAYAADDVVDVYPASLGGSSKIYEPNTLIRARQGVNITAPGAQIDVAVVAGA